VTQAILSAAIFHDAQKARVWLEGKIWRYGPVCTRCGAVDQATLLHGVSHRKGLYQCRACRRPFTITSATPLEQSRVPLNKWLTAIYLCELGEHAAAIGRTIEVSPKTAWFVYRRIGELKPPFRDLFNDEEKLAILKNASVAARGENSSVPAPLSTKLVSEKIVQAKGEPQFQSPEPIPISDTPADSWVDDVAVLRTKEEKDLLEQIVAIQKDLNESMFYALKTRGPNTARTHFASALRSHKALREVFKTLDFLRFAGEKNRTDGKKRRIKKSVLARSDRLLQAFLTDPVELMKQLRDQCHKEARRLTARPYPPPLRDQHGRAVGENRSDWDTKFLRLANDAAKEGATWLRVGAARARRRGIVMAEDTNQLFWNGPIKEKSKASIKTTKDAVSGEAP